jgi:hypothetical protein
MLIDFNETYNEEATKFILSRGVADIVYTEQGF